MLFIQSGVPGSSSGVQSGLCVVQHIYPMTLSSKPLSVNFRLDFGCVQQALLEQRWARQVFVDTRHEFQLLVRNLGEVELLGVVRLWLFGLSFCLLDKTPRLCSRGTGTMLSCILCWLMQEGLSDDLLHLPYSCVDIAPDCRAAVGRELVNPTASQLLGPT